MAYRLTILLAIIIFSAFGGCTREPELESYPEVSFANEVRPIIAANCTQAGCHGPEGRQFPLTNHEEIAGAVTPYNARKSDLYKSITGRAERLMPPSGPLSDDQIRTIFVWIEQGAKNN
ncbi:MAG: c-type cytochrome [Bacteroidota bacterium]